MEANETRLDLGATVRELYGIVARLEAAYPGRHFTLDGHLVGSIGEVYARERYGIHLYGASRETHDGYWPDTEDSAKRKQVQIKVTQRDSVAISDCPEHLIALRLGEDGAFVEVYNGPGDRVWDAIDAEHRKRPKNGQFQVSLHKLRQIAETVGAASQIPPVEQRRVDSGGCAKRAVSDSLPRER